jgi:hypothetical protein
MFFFSSAFDQTPQQRNNSMSQSGSRNAVQRYAIAVGTSICNHHVGEKARID